MDYKTLEYELTGLANLLELGDVSIKVSPVKPSLTHVSSRISPQNGQIEISIDEDWDITKDFHLTRYLNKGYHEDPLLEISQDLIYNNIAHHQICPQTIEIHYKILDKVATVLKDKGKGLKKPEKFWVEYITHAFEDIIANSWCKSNFYYFKGMPIFFYDQAYRASSKKSTLREKLRNILRTPKFSPFYEAFVKINLSIWGDEEDFSLLKKFFTNKAPVNQAVKRVVNLVSFGENSLEEKVHILSHKETWEDLVEKFTLYLAHLLEEAPKENLSSENEFEKGILNPNIRKQIIKGMYQQKKKKLVYFKSFEVTKTVYELLASEIPVQVDTEKEGRAMPVVPFDYDPFDPEVHSTKEIDLQGVVIDPESPFFNLINFRVPRYHYDLFIPYREKQKGAFPDICFIIDTSASMADDVESKISLGSANLAKKLMKSRFFFGETNYSWSDKSKYHHVLLGFNGVLKWLQSHGIAPYIQYNLITFSRQTRASGWKNYEQIDDCKRLAYSPEFNTTLIEEKILKKELLGREPFLLITLSDGEIFNWNKSTKGYSPHRLKNIIGGIKAIAPIMKKIVEENMVSHIQISEGDFKPRISQITCQDLQNWGAKVYRINDINRLENLMIKITKKVMAPYL